MGYFSNGTEAQLYQERWCERCINWKDKGDGRGEGCPIMDAHWLYNRDQFTATGRRDGKLADLLRMLIPDEEDGIFNGECTMFLPADVKVERIFQEPEPQAFELLRDARQELLLVAQGIEEAAEAQAKALVDNYEGGGTAPTGVFLAHIWATSKAREINDYLERKRLREQAEGEAL